MNLGIYCVQVVIFTAAGAIPATVLFQPPLYDYIMAAWIIFIVICVLAEARKRGEI